MTHHHRKSLFLLLFYSLLAILTTADDGATMSDLLKSLSSPPPGWSSTTNFCNWKGVTCDSQKQVTSISLSNQKLTGSLPPSLSSLSALKTLSLQGNSLAGPLPTLNSISTLEAIYLDGNNFTEIPKGCFKGLTALQVLSIGDNGNLAPWVLPLELTDSSGLVKLYAGSSNVVGEIPDFFDKFTSLQEVRLSYNNLTGGLPGSLGKSQIQNFWINNQMVGLEGGIDVLGNMTMVSQVWLHKNRFTGPIPDLSQCDNLFDLNLRDNMLTGPVPDTLAGLKSLQNVSLVNNKLQGPVPHFPSSMKVDLGTTNSFCRKDPGPCDPQVTALLDIAGKMGYPMKLAESWEGNDACNGWTSVVCDSQKNVVTVNFQNQHFGGTISDSYAKLTSLRSLYLNGNNLTGTIPDSLTKLTNLQVLNVSNNNLYGKLPKFPPSVKLITGGNPNIGKEINPGGGGGGDKGSGSGSGDNSSGSSSGTKVSTGVIVGVVIAAVLFVSVVSFIVYRCCTKGWHKKFGKVPNPESGSDIVKNGPINNTNAYGAVPSELQSQSSGDQNNELHVSDGGNVAISIQVLRQVTNNFSEDNILGKGGFGVVYKGELHDGTQIAVKRMEFVQMASKGMNEFQAEIAVLTKVRHRHLVALLGYCINGNERLLVFEYMPQGDLTAHLFEWREHGYSLLTWKQRVTIALDVARGVEYLHSLAQQSFIHRDLKPSNILLGDDMRAKVADFGLVKNAPDGKYSVETKLAGTFGYLAPEYAATGRVTTKVDVYAFGVILMELITGRKALDDSVPDERSHLVTWFRRIMINKENIAKAIDQNLQPVDDETLNSIYRVAELAGHCTAREPYQRPDMGHAVNILSPLVEQWKPSSQDDEENSGIDFQMSLPQALQRWQANEGTSTMYGFSYSESQSSIPSKPSGFDDSSVNAR